MEEKLLQREEQAVFALRSLYRGYGYLPYKMSKFEEYDLYVRNKDFLVSDRIIAFNDTNGRLLALKPDVTLSIIKSGEDQPGVKRKLCYNENVYRVSGGTHQFKEILQTGLECIGDIDGFDLFEVVSLAAKSLSLMGENYVLDVAHLGILGSMLEELQAPEELRRQIAGCVASRNRHDLERFCKEAGVPDEDTARLSAFVGIYGEPEAVLRRLEPICRGEAARAALCELRELAAMLSSAGLTDRIRFDFSIVNDMNYYNGIVFRGFLDGICEGILSGGQYNKLMQRMGRSSGGVGFAIYLDLLEELKPTDGGYDLDVLVLYNEATDLGRLAATVSELRADGKSVGTQKAIPAKLRYRELKDLRR